MSDKKYLKFSVIMQVYLGDYSGSRIYSREKFIRAINSFLSQSYPHKELIIVSDGCVFAKNIYELIYTSNDKIKFVWLERTEDEKKMYDKDKNNNKTYFRGKPKAVGCEHATGDIICYLDSDDIMLPDHLFALNAHWNMTDERVLWGANTMRIMNTKFLEMDLPHERKEIYSFRTLDLSAYGIYEDFFVNMCSRYNEISCATYCISHRKNISIKWEDTIGVHEDKFFVSRLNDLYPTSLRISSPSMVVCHYRNGWDV